MKTIMTKPDDAILTQWMDGELEGDALTRVDAWAQDHPKLLTERAAVQAMSASIRENVASREDPPYADFFNQRILRAIEDDQQAVTAPLKQSGSLGFWQWILAPMAAAAMAVCFYLGTQVHPESAPPVATVHADVISVYTPDGTVHADMFKSDDAEATVIVLVGLRDLPDHLEMAGAPVKGESNTMMISTEQNSHVY